MPLAGGDRLGVTVAGQGDLGLGLFAAGPGGAFDALAGLELLVDLEEMLDLGQVELGQVVDIE